MTIMPASRVFHVFAGTRPEVVKLAPVVRALRVLGANVVMVATGQQRDPAMMDQSYRSVGLKPDVTWSLSGGQPAERSGSLYSHALRYIAETGEPDVMVVQGDTTTVPLVAHAARANERCVAHVEAGLRSLNEQSLEESNRKIAAAVASIHFAPTGLARGFLLSEGIADERIFVVGNTACDALLSSGVKRHPPEERRGGVVTAHRATNVDDPGRLLEIISIVSDLVRATGHVVFPLHPRTRDRARTFGLLDRLSGLPGVQLCDPLPYHAMLAEIAKSRIVVTDSGGLQEEAAWYGVPCVVMRRSTPRWEGILNGSAALAGVSRERVHELATEMLSPEAQLRIASIPCPYGRGDAGERIAASLTSSVTSELLLLREPDFTD
ncbi:MAG: UDP-N-acetylglucosamine 2-epimerase (non-hydrolyzing), partial [Deltaproteobacteria bacterium]|nr:UDP-N-acetylglucosamine 2-epimerase (non-hydrolyzing) [Deltaproteobacteria bacterium]